MSAKSGVDWTDASWSPMQGCTPVSPACERCYAAAMARRFAGSGGWPTVDPFRPMLHPERLDQPLRWRKPKKIFVCPVGDLFHEAVPDEYIDQVFAIMARASQHTFQVLTKRPERMRRWFTDTASGAQREQLVYETMRSHGSTQWLWHGWPLPNIWLGVTAEDQQRAEERIPLLLETPAARRFVSCEPLLSAVDLSRWMNPAVELQFKYLSWIIAGGESGPGARPTHPAWFEGLRDQCQAAGVPFYFKGWGEWAPHTGTYGTEDKRYQVMMPSGHLLPPFSGWGLEPETRLMRRVGKKAAGYLLDGVEHREFPE